MLSRNVDLQELRLNSARTWHIRVGEADFGNVLSTFYALHPRFGILVAVVAVASPTATTANIEVDTLDLW